MTRPYYEIVTYRVGDPPGADAARASAQNTLKHFPGFIDWTAFSGAEDPAERVDLVVWRTLDDAHAAAKRVGTAPEFEGFRTSIAAFGGMSHYVASVLEPHSVGGVEFGRFRLKPGVSEEDMRKAHRKMVESYLADQAGWWGQHLLKLDDGVFIDLAFADSRTRSEQICASWRGQEACEAFLSLIDAESMEFGSVL